MQTIGREKEDDVAPSPEETPDQQSWDVFNPELSTWPLLKDAEPATPGEEDPGTADNVPPAPSTPASPQPASRPSGVGRRTLLVGVAAASLLGGFGVASTRLQKPQEPVPSLSPLGLPPPDPNPLLKSPAGFLPLRVGELERFAFFQEQRLGAPWQDAARYVDPRTPPSTIFDFRCYQANQRLSEREAMHRRGTAPDRTLETWRTGALLLLRETLRTGRVVIEVEAELQDGYLLTGQLGSETASPQVTELVTVAQRLLDVLPVDPPANPARPGHPWPDTPLGHEARFPDTLRDRARVIGQGGPHTAIYQAADRSVLTATITETEFFSTRADLSQRRRHQSPTVGLIEHGIVYQEGDWWIADRVINHGTLQVRGETAQVAEIVQELARALR